MHNNIISRAKPQLIRRKTHVVHPSNVNIVVSTQLKPPIKAKEPKRQTIVAPSKGQAPQAQPASLATKNPILKRRKTSKKTQVTYITTDPLPESHGRISSVHKIGRGRILIIVGNGPSILETNLERLSGHPKIDILSVNKPDSRIWPTKFWAFFDQTQFVRHQDIWNGYNGYVFNSTSIRQQKSTSMQFKNFGGKGWSRDLMKGIYIGRSSVFASMQIAMWMQFEHIYIFGCDMSPDGIDGKLHFYGVNPDVDPEKRKTRFKQEAECYSHAAEMMSEEERMKFTFCSSYNKWEFIEKFNRQDHKTAVDSILTHAASI